MYIKKILIGAVLAVSALSMLAEATARPMGGGRTIGRQSQNVSRMPPATAPAPAPRQAAPAPAPAAPAAIPPKPASPWKGILGGALLGLGIGALFSHFGMGGAIGSLFGTLILLALVGGVVFLIVRLVRGRAQPAPAAFGGNGGGNNVYQMQPSRTPDIGSRLQPEPVQQAAAPVVHTPWGVPADFDAPSFLRVAKSNFIRLQAAWDKGDSADIREFTTPEVFAELKMQISERGAQKDYTDVVTIDAELLGIETSDHDYLASVKFTGTIKPAPDALAEPFNEVWNLSKPVSGASGWMLAGIQQLA
ncbi:Tim44 domain-containing protein [Duganella sp. BJB488]|uniref:Tim44 domain-containing protein n=1 Tax=unclassified Duganella TaxID=2636909 RepID=UPI000E348498|nr:MULTISPECIES: Tim44-like domain-containing protein [unclassified Duganella]RFP14038.1 Tim44 domain-containing protein [Duganella sp. BJB489]RFP17378.1 Tim44 domain-containing protein [Duganella sp. BJB488]RFP31832.1 Tim44 domain-containing protein [Duganella sp. BJB480]